MHFTRKSSLFGLALGLLFQTGLAQKLQPTRIQPDRWSLKVADGLDWNVATDGRLPHQDHVEMSGRQLSAIIRYGADANRNLTLRREIIWPMLRTIPGPSEPSYAVYRAYLQRAYTSDVAVPFTLDGKPGQPGPLETVRLDGLLTFRHQARQGVQVSRTLFPSTDKTVFVERWQFKNTSQRPVRIAVTAINHTESLTGVYGRYDILTTVAPVAERQLGAGESLTVALLFSAHDAKNPAHPVNDGAEEANRRAFVRTVSGSLVLDTPDPLLNRAFAFAKIRTSESLFNTKMGLVHSPGGGRYYGGVWANDQVEYAGPFFPFLGYAPANAASLNAYRIFARAMKPDYSRIWASFEMEGDYPCCSKDRGDAAMYAYGASRFSLALGDTAVARELWPAINWALEYCRRHTTSEGVIASETDEMEGRVPTGSANLATSSLAYDALRSAAYLGRSLGKTDTARLYDGRADTLRRAIETYFGANIQGFHTYKYFKEHQSLRHWICLPLTMGILERKDGTIQALLTKLWMADGLAVEAGQTQFWDRGTLYALRGLFNAGETETGLTYLRAYTRQRLVGDHVPYPVEASPEGGQAHLAAESALYGRVITEGLFGIRVVGLRSLECLPRLPAAWPRMRLLGLNVFGQTTDLLVERKGNKVHLTISRKGQVVTDQTKPVGETFSVSL